MIDFNFLDVGSFVLVRPEHEGVDDTLCALVDDDAMWQGDNLIVEPRYAPELSAMLCREGYTVELPNGRVVTSADLR